MSVMSSPVRNGVDTEQLFGTLDLIKAPAGAGAFQFRATQPLDRRRAQPLDDQGLLRRRQEDTSRGEAFDLDAGEPAILLGTDTGPNPAEYLLHALAACLTTSLVYVAAARKVRLTSVESTLTATWTCAARSASTTSCATASSASASRSASRATRRRRSCARSSSARSSAPPSTTWSPTACRSRSASIAA